MKITINNSWHVDNLFDIGKEIWFHDLNFWRNEDRGLQSADVKAICFDGTNFTYAITRQQGEQTVFVEASNAFSTKEEAIENIYNVKILREESNENN